MISDLNRENEQNVSNTTFKYDVEVRKVKIILNEKLL